jgi:adenine deaminase
MMNYPGVIHEDPEVLRKIENTRKHRKPVDGHAPGLTGRDLYAYIAAGISSDHESITAREATEKLNAGMYIMIREGTGAKNLNDLIPVISSRTAPRMMWCTDDRHPHDLLEEGHIDSMVRRAIRATINPADYFGLGHLGAIGPGRQADMVVFSDIGDIHVEQVYHQGLLVAEDGKILPEIDAPDPISVRPSMNLEIEEIDFSIPIEGRYIRVVEVVPHQVVTRQCIKEASISEKAAVSDISRDILKIMVVDRHSGSGNTGKGFVTDFGLKRGALASSVAHDSHNIIVVGTNDGDMKTAVQALITMGGGLAAVCDNKVCADLSLPIAGLMSLEPIQTINDQLDRLLNAAREFGSTLNDPFMTLSFLALPVIPELKITDKGLVDVT